MSKYVCFGEIMARLNPTGYLRLVQAEELKITYAGGEANVAVSLANYGKEVSFVTKLPDNDLTKSAIRRLRGYGIDVSHITIGGERMGIYFVEKGASQRSTRVIYDRKYSSMALADPQDFNWDEIFKDAEWFFFTGITPALSYNAADICLEACRKAKEKGITIGCDLNYRNKLWTAEKAGQVMGSLMEYADVVIANAGHCNQLFGIKVPGTEEGSGELSKEGYKEIADILSKKFNIPTVALTYRDSISANDNKWAGMLYQKGECYFSKEYLIHMIDRVGGGDAFSGGLIYALSSGYPPQQAIEYAAAASCLKHTVENDYSEATVEEVEKLMNGDGSGRVER